MLGIAAVKPPRFKANLAVWLFYFRWYAQEILCSTQLLPMSIGMAGMCKEGVKYYNNLHHSNGKGHDLSGCAV
jgi:hypothetical protein